MQTQVTDCQADLNASVHVHSAVHLQLFNWRCSKNLKNISMMLLMHDSEQLECTISSSSSSSTSAGLPALADTAGASSAAGAAEVFSGTGAAMLAGLSMAAT